MHEPRNRQTLPAPVAVLDNCSKQYPGVMALKGANFSIAPGEVRALLGKNGAGKSTLVRLLSGAETPDGGTVTIDGVPLGQSGASRAQEAYRRGVRVVYQELSLVPEMSIAENLFMGRWPRKGGMLDLARMESEAQIALSRLGLDLPPARPVAALSPAERQLVEIARILLGVPRLVILDEPTSSLAAAEAGMVIAAVKRIAESGIAVIYISHRMNEIREIADTASVIRDGRIMETVAIGDADTGEIVRLMLGSATSPAVPVESRARDAVVLDVEDLFQEPRLKGVSFRLREGEVLGIAGLLGAGRTELLHAILGLRPIQKGRITLRGTRVSRPRYHEMIRRGLGYTPESRKEDGIVPLLGVDENTVMSDFASVSRAGIFVGSLVARATRRIIDLLDVKTPHTGSPIGTLSGGNQQKVVIGRWAHSDSQILLLDEPTRGVDVEAKNQIYSIIRDLAAEGRSILFVSSEFEEFPLVCDRVLVLRNGQFRKEFVSPHIDPEAIMAASIAGQ